MGNRPSVRATVPDNLGSDFYLFETMLSDSEGRIARLELHIARLFASARLFGFLCDRQDIEHRLRDLAGQKKNMRLRLSLQRDGTVAVESLALPIPPCRPMRIVVREMTLPPADCRLHHKMSLRDHYDRPRQAAMDAGEVDEVVFTDAAGFLTEGSFTSLFVRRGDSLVTPPLSRGLLPGVLRAALLAEGRCVEADLRVGDLAHGLMVGNSLRGLMDAVLVREA